MAQALQEYEWIKFKEYSPQARKENENESQEDCSDEKTKSINDSILIGLEKPDEQSAPDHCYDSINVLNESM